MPSSGGQHMSRFAVVHCKWRHYVQDKHTKVYTDNVSLRYFQSQPKLTPKQARWQDRLAEFDIEIIQKPGKANVMPDALSRLPYVNAMTCVNSTLLQEIRNALRNDTVALRTMQNFHDGKTAIGLFDIRDGLLYAHNRIYVPDAPALKARLLCA